MRQSRKTTIYQQSISKPIAFCSVGVILGSKFQRNSGRSSCSVPDSGVFWPGMFRLRFRRSGRFLLTHFHISADLNAPLCEAGLIRSERAYLSFLSLCTSKRSRYRGSLSWVAFKLKKNDRNRDRSAGTLGLIPGSDRIPTHERPEPWPEFVT
jgi:hypothetical protein